MQSDLEASVEYNPLDKANLGISIRDALLKRDPLPMNPWPDKFSGAGIYTLYYSGNFRPYAPIAKLNRGGCFGQPIYVGKAVPAGARKGGVLKGRDTASAVLHSRIKEHAKSIREVENLKIEDFHFRYLEVDDIWIPLGETYIIDRFEPLWNKVVEGFGIHTPGKRRKDQYSSPWDTLHPGRDFVSTLRLPPNPKTVNQILDEVQRFLELPAGEKAKVSIKETGGVEDELEQ
jgi:hypothetical protein